MSYKIGDWIPSNKSILGIILRLPMAMRLIRFAAGN
jgi:hypothetical protein